MILRRAALLLALAAGLPAAPVAAAPADDEQLAEDDRVTELERKVELLTDELARTRQDMGVPEEQELESAWGLGPGASKIYGIGRGLSIGGYAEGQLHNVVSTSAAPVTATRPTCSARSSTWDTSSPTASSSTPRSSSSTPRQRRHNGAGGDVSVEFATLDFLCADELNSAPASC